MINLSKTIFRLTAKIHAADHATASAFQGKGRNWVPRISIANILFKPLSFPRFSCRSLLEGTRARAQSEKKEKDKHACSKKLENIDTPSIRK